MGPLGPETLTHHHKLSEEACLALYGLMHRHTTGFQREAAQLLQGAAHREQLLAALWRAFAQLWDDTVQVGGGGCCMALVTWQAGGRAGANCCLGVLNLRAGCAVRACSCCLQVLARDSVFCMCSALHRASALLLIA